MVDAPRRILVAIAWTGRRRGYSFNCGTREDRQYGVEELETRLHFGCARAGFP